MSAPAVTTSAYIATSLDGFIAREDGGLDWLPGIDREGGEDYGYADFIASIDTLVMGRNTFDKVCSFPEWPYGDTPVVVLSHHPLVLPPTLEGRVDTLAGPPAAIVAQLAERGARHLYIDGGRTIQAFIAAGLLQRLIITRIPILIGRGIPLFGPLPYDIPLHHIRTRSFADGLVQSEYSLAPA